MNVNKVLNTAVHQYRLLTTIHSVSLHDTYVFQTSRCSLYIYGPLSAYT